LLRQDREKEHTTHMRIFFWRKNDVDRSPFSKKGPEAEDWAIKSFTQKNYPFWEWEHFRKYRKLVHKCAARSEFGYYFLCGAITGIALTLLFQSRI